MQGFEGKAQFEAIMNALFDRLMETPRVADPLKATRMKVRFRYPDIKSVLTFDFTEDPPRLWREESGGADVEMAQTSEVAHQFWLGRLHAVRAISTGKVRAKGDISKALKLLPAIKPAFTIYPDVLRELKLDHLIPEEAAPRHGVLDWRRIERFVRGLIPGKSVVDRSSLPRDARPEVERGGAREDGTREAKAPPLPQEASALRVEMLRRMVLIREFEEMLSTSWNAGEVPTSAIHLSIGQEAVAVGVCFALRPDDCIATTHRGHGHMLAKGAPSDRMMAEIFGKQEGLCEGKGGSMHVTDAAVGALGANGIVGSSPLLAMGAALAFAYQQKDRVAVAFLGDGATNQGMFHEAVNLASVWKLPVLFVIENNQYGEFTAQSKSTRVTKLSQRAEAYGIPGLTIDGNDVDKVFDVTSKLVTKLRAGKGPALLECLTYRWHGHMEGDLQKYRSEEEVAEWKRKDPIDKMGQRLIEQEVVDRHAVDLAHEAMRSEIADAKTFALAGKDPSSQSLGTDIFAPDPPLDHTATSPTMESITGSAAINLALKEEMLRDDSVILLGEDVSYGGYLAVTAGLVEQFGRDRIRDTPISENAIVGGSVGAAMNGLRPVAEILFADFLTTCLDPLVNQAAKLRYMSGGQYQIPMVVRTPCGVGLGMAAQHSQSMESLLMGIPGLIVAAPSSPRDCRGMLKAAIRSNNPVVFFEHKLLYLTEGDVPREEEVIGFGKARVVREGKDVTVVGLLYTVQQALEAADLLAKEGIEVEVIDPRTLAPLDVDTILDSVAKTGYLVTVEEGPVRHGWGAEVVARVATAAHGLLRAPPRRLGGSDNPIPYNKPLENLSVPDVERIAAAIREAVSH